MIIKCTTCRRNLDDHKDVRWDMRGCGTFCGLACIWKYRGKRRLV